MEPKAPLSIKSVSYRNLVELGVSGSSPRSPHQTPRTPKRNAVNPQLKHLNIVETLKQFSISTPRSLSARTPRPELAKIIEDSPCEQAVRVVADICGKVKRMSGPPIGEFHYTEWTDRASESSSAAAAAVPLITVAAAVATASSKIILPDKASRQSVPGLRSSSNLEDIQLTISSPREVQVERVVQDAWNLEMMIETKHLKLEQRVQELASLEIPLKADELRMVLRELDMKKSALAANVAIRYPAAFRVQVSGGGAILQVHNKKKIYLYFPAHTISEGEYKTVYHGWSVVKKIKRVAIAIAKLSSSPRGIAAASLAAANEERYLKRFNNLTYFVKLYDAIYFPDNKQVLVMKWYPQDCLDVINQHIDQQTPQEYKYSIIQKLKLIITIFEGIQFMQARNVVHRDVKPDNYLIDDKGIRLTDFGFTTDASDIGELNQFKGSYPYVPYEMLKGELFQNGFAQDNWGAACIAYLLLVERAYPWHKYLVASEMKKDMTKAKRNAMEAIMKFHQNVPTPQSPIPRLFWELFHPLPSQRPPVHEIIERLKLILCNIQNPPPVQLPAPAKPTAKTAANPPPPPVASVKGPSAASTATSAAAAAASAASAGHNHRHHHRSKKHGDSKTQKKNSQA